MTSKKKMLRAPDMKTIEARKQVVTKFYKFAVAEAKDAASATDPQYKVQEDIQFPVGRIVCEHLALCIDNDATASPQCFSYVTSDLFEGGTIGYVGEKMERWVTATYDVITGINQTTSGAEIAFAEPKKIKGNYAFHVYDDAGDLSYLLKGHIIAMVKFYEY